MTVSYKGERPEFSSDHEYTTVIWLLSDGANVPFSDYFDNNRMFNIKLDTSGYARLRAMAAIFIQPYLRQVYLRRIVGTLHWGSSAIATSETLTKALDIRITSGNGELAPDHKQWGAALAKHGPDAFKDMQSLRRNFSDLLAKDGERVGNIILHHAKVYQLAKTADRCERGDGIYNYGNGLLMTVIGPVLSAALAHLTGIWPSRDLKPGDGFKLTFTGEKLTKVQQLWIDLSLGSDELQV